MVRGGMWMAAAVAVALAMAPAAQAQDAIKALYITGGGWHDYPGQERILTEGIGERINIEWTIDNDAGDDSGHWPERFERDDWMAGFDVVVYNFCVTEVPGAEEVEGVVRQHEETGVPAVFVHCAIHSFRADTTRWFEFGGVTSHRHEAARPYLVENLAPDHAIMAGFPERWQTPQGELYEIVKLWPGATPLAHAYGEDTERHHTVIWTNQREGVRVFATTIGHHNETMAEPVYLDVVARGLLWSVGRLGNRFSDAEWEVLFDGSSTEKWRAFRGDEFPSDGWEVAGDTLRTVPDGGPDIITREKYSDFELYLEWMTPEGSGGNSGLFHLVTEESDATWHTGPEIQIFNDHHHHHGGESRAKGSAGALYDLVPPNDQKVLKPEGEFNESRLIVRGDDAQFWLNGRLITRYELGGEELGALIADSKFDHPNFSRAGEGHIALQHHGDEVVFRNILIRDLSGGEEAAAADAEGWISLFDGESLDGWRASENRDSFFVEDGRIVAHGPRSHLFYAGSVEGADFENFEFKADILTYPQANSGIFFHTQYQDSGWPSHGYEAQVNATHGDRIKTGSVYGVQNVMDEAPHGDEEWWNYHIIVKDDTVTIKVDGEVVNEYTETPDTVSGTRRLSSGTIALQAHDPESRIYFKNLYVRPLD